MSQLNTDKFDEMWKFIDALPIDEWEMYRPMPLSKTDVCSLSTSALEALTQKILAVRQETDKKIFIANAIPLCSIKQANQLSSICKGSFFDDGFSRLVIDPRNFVKPHY